MHPRLGAFAVCVSVGSLKKITLILRRGEFETQSIGSNSRSARDYMDDAYPELFKICNEHKISIYPYIYTLERISIREKKYFTSNKRF